MLAARPTHVRHLVIAVSVLMSIKLYLDRFSLSSMQPYITEELGLSKFAVASFLGMGFFLSYALGQVPAGWLGDRFGPRTMLAAYILVWSAFTGLTGLAEGFLMLMVARLGCGLGQAGAYPACGNLLSKWVPLSTRATASSLVALGGRLGAVIAPVLTGLLIVAFVPTSTPVEFTADQVPNAAKVCARLTIPASQTPESKHLASLLPEGVAPEIRRGGEDYVAWESLLRQNQQAGKPTSPATVGSPTQAALLSGLNDLLDDPRLREGRWLARLDHPFSKLVLEREARVAMTRVDEGESLSEAEGRRVNRMIIEAAVPEVRKLYGRGWRPVLWLYGASGILVAAIFWAMFRDHPREHPWCNSDEIALIEEGKPKQPPRAAAGIPLLAILKSRSLWLSSLSQVGTNVGWLLVVTYMPQYLLDVYKSPLTDRSYMTAIPAIGGIVGMFSGGWLTDVLTRNFGLRWGRALPMGLTRFGAAAAYVVLMFSNDPWVATGILTVMFFFVDLGVSATWAFTQDVGGRNVGSVLGWGNMWGNIGAAVAPYLYSLCLGDTPGVQEWNKAFTVCAAVFVISGFAAMGIDATRPITPETPSDEPGASA